jgi:hypothetical protein
MPMKRNMKGREVAPGVVMPPGLTKLSATMFKFACEMARQAEHGDFQPRLAYPMASVIHAAASLEAFLNEEVEKIVATWGAEWQSTIEALERLDVTKKWIIFPRLLHNKEFDSGAEPFQSFSGLVDLRNTLMHYRPIVTADLYVPKKVDGLRNKFSFDSHENQDWTSKVLTPSCARWACTTARDMIREYFLLTGEGELWPTAEEMTWHLSLGD